MGSPDTKPNFGKLKLATIGNLFNIPQQSTLDALVE